MNNEDKNSSPQPKTDLQDSATYTQDVPSDISMSEQRDDGIGAGKKQKPQHLLSRWWRNKKARYGTIIFLFVFADQNTPETLSTPYRPSLRYRNRYTR